jgi:hypothetical protein
LDFHRLVVVVPDFEFLAYHAAFIGARSSFSESGPDQRRPPDRALRSWFRLAALPGQRKLTSFPGLSSPT